jgi:hypothetical protein
MPRYFPLVLDLDDLEPGSVLLPHGADERAVEGALAGVGIYAPRGPEIVVWSREHDPHSCDPEATIYDAYGLPLVHLFTFPVSLSDVVKARL